jgi:glycosyltransferase involved in cell wall biosynthesis
LDQLWAIDLVAHLDYLKKVTVLAPCHEITAPTSNMVKIPVPEESEIHFMSLGLDGRGVLSAVLSLPKCISQVWRAIGNSDLVHSGVAGWPIPPGLIVNPVAVIRNKPLIIIIESAFWRLQEGRTAKQRERLRAFLTEAFARWTLRRAAFAVYTNEGYRNSLPIGPEGTGLVLPASWIAETDILTEAQAIAHWQNKPSIPHFLVASRLVEEKGISFLLNALHQLEAQGQSIHIDIIGEGPLGHKIGIFAANAKNVHLRMLKPVPYGQPFLGVLRNYHAVIVPTTGDEQPRILYDAFSQAVAIIATATAGNLEVVEHDKTGYVVTTKTASGLVDALSWLSQKPADLQRMGLAGLALAQNYTHTAMHSQRAEALLKAFGPEPR